MVEASEKSVYNKVETIADKKLGVIACGIGYNYVKEAVGDNANILKISQYPLPADKVMQLAKECDEILVVEDGQPVVEEEARRIIGDVAPIKGRYTGDLPRYGELTPDSVAKALGVELPEGFAPAKNLAARPPQLCQGCGHRDVYGALRQIIDEFDPEYGIVYVDSTPFLETDLSDIDITNQWTIDQSLTPEITLWKVRIAVSGKGSAPRFKLFSRNEKRFELLGVNWISRVMNMR
jgi:hypothetical protein